MKIKPTGDFVAIRLDKEQKEIVTLFISERTPQIVGIGEIIAVGSRVTTLKVGDRVHTGHRAPIIHESLKTNEKPNIVFLQENDIFAKLNNE